MMMDRLFVGLCFALIMFSSALADDRVPPRAAGYWEFQEQWVMPNYPNGSTLHKSTYHTCIKEGDPEPQISNDIYLIERHPFLCIDKTVRIIEKKFILEKKCQVDNWYVNYREIYYGDFSKKLNYEKYTIENGKENLMEKKTMTRIGNCPPGK